MQDQPVVGVAPLLGRHEARDIVFHISWCLAKRQAKAMRYSKDVRVHGESRLFECDRHHDIRGFPSHAV